MLSEYQECKLFYEWAQHVPLAREYLLHIPNEGKRPIQSLVKLKSIGLRAGIPDYFFPLSNSIWHGLWLEMKRKDQRHKKKRATQNEWIEKLMKIGHYASYVYGADDAIAVFNDYINNKV